VTPDSDSRAEKLHACALVLAKFRSKMAARITRGLLQLNRKLSHTPLLSYFQIF